MAGTVYEVIPALGHKPHFNFGASKLATEDPYEWINNTISNE